MQPLVKWALESLGKVKVEEAVPQLIELLKDQNPEIRWVAVVALGKIGRGSADAAAALRGSLQDSDAEVREAAIWSLSRVDRAAVNVI